MNSAIQTGNDTHRTEHPLHPHPFVGPIQPGSEETKNSAVHAMGVVVEKIESIELGKLIESNKSKTGTIQSPWFQLVVGVLCMVMIANLQYGWTFFVPGIQEKFGWSRADIQMAFTLFILFETWLVPVEGWFVDKYGPACVVLAGGLACGIGWAINSQASSLGQFYMGQIVTGIGAGAVYGTCIGNALKWFPGRRGLAAGITAAGFGAGSALTVALIQMVIKTSGFQEAFLYFGVIQGLIICIFAFFLAAPKKGQISNHASSSTNNPLAQRNYLPQEVIGPLMGWLGIAGAGTAISAVLWFMGLQFYIPLALASLIFCVGGFLILKAGQPVFLLMYAMFVLVGAGGLVVTANLASIAQDLKVAGVSVSIAWLTLPALTFAATIDRVLNGLTRPFFGWISDKVGRENCMFIAFFFEGIGIYALHVFGSDPFWFVILTGLVFFAWGEIYSLFPATCTDTFGPKFASTNSGMLYTAKGTAALLVPYASSIEHVTGSWGAVFSLAAGCNILAALLALFLLKPLRKKLIKKDNEIIEMEDRSTQSAQQKSKV